MATIVFVYTCVSLSHSSTVTCLSFFCYKRLVTTNFYTDDSVTFFFLVEFFSSFQEISNAWVFRGRENDRSDYLG